MFTDQSVKITDDFQAPETMGFQRDASGIGPNANEKLALAPKLPFNQTSGMATGQLCTVDPNVMLDQHPVSESLRSPYGGMKAEGGLSELCGGVSKVAQELGNSMMGPGNGTSLQIQQQLAMNQFAFKPSAGFA